jgi:hypothetical protein
MKRRHAAMIALMGWYLMLPPLAGSRQRLIFAPLSQWKTIDKFDSKARCEDIRRQLIARMPGTAIDTSRCISEDDPGLNPSPALITMTNDHGLKGARRFA